MNADGWTSKLGIAYVIVTTVLFLFPPELPVTGSNMSTLILTEWHIFILLITISDYCIVAFFIVLLISTIQWFIDGSKNFSGPQVDLDAIRSGKVDIMAATAEGDSKLDVEKDREIAAGNGALGNGL